VLVIGAVLVALGAATALSVLRPGLPSVVAVVAAGVAWWLVNGPVEGRVLHVVTQTHGLTQADLLVPPAVVVAVLAAARRRALRRAARSDGAGVAPRG
jgi:hypothetical protein